MSCRNSTHFPLNKAGGCFLGFLLSALLIMPFDALISRYAYYDWVGNDTVVRMFLERSEPFGHGIGIAWIVIAIFILDPNHRKACLSLTTTALCAGGIANIIKLFVCRARPREFDFNTNPLFVGFKDWSPDQVFRSAELSFPSAHTTTAVALTVFLSTMYPRGRWLFTILAIVVGLQRIHGGSHFPSDILVGAGLGCFVGHICVGLAHRYRYLPFGSVECQGISHTNTLRQEVSAQKPYK
ncbi:MAG: phosphatase PAP2 family protein [Planctomycetaceae bacterium]|nr:phosphatase PAP2 family protein [Planctomycetaceae bacterium]